MNKKKQKNFIRPQISILTLVKGRGGHLAHMLEALARLPEPPAEIIVVCMDPAPCHISQDHLNLQQIHLPCDRPRLAEARNLAAGRARHEFLFFLDVDCIPSTASITAMHDAMAAHDALICPEILYLGADAVGDDWQEDSLRRSGLPHPIRPFPDSGVRSVDNAGLFWSLAFGIRKTTFQRIGGFDAGFTGYGAEDTDLGFSARRHGVKLLFLGGAPVFHQHHAIHDPPLQHFNDIIRNAERFFTKWHIWPMDGWLAAFSARGLIRWSSTDITILREPDAAEIAQTRLPADRRF